MPPSLAYMMLSRSESIDDLFIAGRFDSKKIRCNPKALAEAKRLEDISLTNLPLLVPQPNQVLDFGFVNISNSQYTIFIV